MIHEAIWRSDESSPSFSRLSITLEGLDDAEAASLDTGDILRKFAERFIVSLLDRHSDSRNSRPNHATYFDTQSDLIILSCDFIPPPALKLSSIVNDYRVDLERPLIKALLYERGDSLKDGVCCIPY